MGAKGFEVNPHGPSRCQPQASRPKEKGLRPLMGCQWVPFVRPKKGGKSLKLRIYPSYYHYKYSPTRSKKGMFSTCEFYILQFIRALKAFLPEKDLRFPIKIMIGLPRNLSNPFSEMMTWTWEMCSSDSASGVGLFCWFGGSKRGGRAWVICHHIKSFFFASSIKKNSEPKQLYYSFNVYFFLFLSPCVRSLFIFSWMTS